MRFRFKDDILRAASSAVPPHAARARLTAVCLFLALSAPAAHAQGSDDKPARPILSIGDYPNVNGVALGLPVTGTKGSQHGLTIGIVNYACTLQGVQVGIINIVADATRHPILPLLNWGSR